MQRLPLALRGLKYARPIRATDYGSRASVLTLRSMTPCHQTSCSTVLDDVQLKRDVDISLANAVEYLQPLLKKDVR